LLQDSLFSFAAPDTKTPLDEISLSDGSVEDASWVRLSAAAGCAVESAKGNQRHRDVESVIPV